MKNWGMWVLLLVVGSLMAPTRAAAAGPPERFLVWTDANNLILVQQEDSGYVGLIEGGVKHAWNFKIDDWSLKHIKVTGVSTETDFDGRHQVVVVEGTPDVIKDGIACGKARYTVGHESKSRKVKVTWAVPPPKLTGLSVN